MGKFIVLAALLLLPVLIFTIVRRTGRKHPAGHEHGPAHTHRHIGHKHGGMLSIDYFAYSSKIRGWNPAFKVVLSVLTIVLCIALDNVYVSAVVIVSMAYLVIAAGGLPPRDYLSVLTIPLTFILISILAIVVDFSAGPVGQWHVHIGFGYLYTTAPMLKKGVFLMLKILAAVSALQLMILTTPSSEIISVLRKARVPGILVDLMNLIYRFIFILMDVFARMKNAAESRLGYRDFKTSCYTFGSVASNLLILSLKKAGAYYDAMEARCYDGELLFLEEEKKADIKVVIPAAAFVLYLLLLWYLTRQAV
ncbi:cobalt/nickel transport system permease protein [Sporobacter termitidis DSM 10068]|uniref:Cobalt/nickel transport system permease protein n=1 Tax=Sporobacter termitidis DSM 10068 TaxID=1123282 RepID=A0A1M5XGU3_9FIRM|nr:cobalt ECF transporter T component CbiQ [Sporobacter termitidis]SHH98979.1 cobalt/nickel transport system permease protein [Sporobacter termitidis DSM 10068]